MARSPLVNIIILNWNGWQDTAACVESCRALDWPNFRITIVDNASTDGSEAKLRELFPTIEIIQTGRNLGFAGGNNVGIRKALELGADYVWLLNNDTTVAPDALSALVDALENTPAAGMAGSLIYYHADPERIWTAGGSWQPGCLKLRQRGAYQIDSGQFDRIEEVGSVSGCSLMVKAETVRRVGMLAEEFFLYWEDTDWCARTLAVGEKVLFVPTSRVWHKVSATVKGHSARQYYYHTRNGLLFFKRHDLLSLPFFLVYLVADVVVGICTGRFSMFQGFVHGVFDFARGRTGCRE